MEWIAEWWDRLVWVPDWFATNERNIELFSVWSVFFSALLLGIAGFIFFFTLLGSTDGTPFGSSMKGLMLGLGLYGISRAILWGNNLYAYYTGDGFNLFERTALRVLVGLTGIALVLILIWTMWAYRKENWGRPGKPRPFLPTLRPRLRLRRWK